MKRKAAAKKPSSAAGPDSERADRNGAPEKKLISKRFRKYLDPKFADNLVKHMHLAKKAALKDKE